MLQRSAFLITQLRLRRAAPGPRAKPIGHRSRAAMSRSGRTPTSLALATQAMSARRRGRLGQRRFGLLSWDGTLLTSLRLNSPMPIWRALCAKQSRSTNGCRCSHGQLPPSLTLPKPSELVLSPAASAIARKVQVPLATAGQSVLAVAALVAQGRANVSLPYGQTRPLSLFSVTVAASGDRKTSADMEALSPIRSFEKSLRDKHETENEAWSVAHAAWTAERRKIENKKNLSLESRKDELRNLGAEPAPPLHPFMTSPDPTVEGLAKAWPSAHASLGIFSAEGGQFIGGHGMNQENRLKTAATLSSLWDGHTLKRVRAGEAVSILPGRRLSIHLMVQPDAATEFLTDPVLRDQGLLSRMLVAAPDSIAGTRFYREPRAEDTEDVKAYNAQLLSLLEASLPLVPGRENELDPPALMMTGAAIESWRAFYDDTERKSGPGGELQGIVDVAAKAAEHAARIAGILTIIEDRHATEISGSTMNDAITLVGWYVKEASRLQSACRTDPKLLRAQQLLEWIRDQCSGEVSFRNVLHRGPNPLRTKAVAEEAFEDPD